MDIHALSHRCTFRLFRGLLFRRRGPSWVGASEPDYNLFISPHHHYDRHQGDDED